MIACKLTEGVVRSRLSRRSEPCAVVLALVVLALVVSVSGCAVGYNNRDPKEWPADQKAREITRLRKLAREHLSNYGVHQRIEDLNKVVEAERQTTEIAPSTCPTCFREYGLALSMAGRHYSYLLQDVREELRTARRAESERLRQERDAYLDERIRYLQLSRRAYEGYFRHPATTAVTPKDLRRVMNDQEILGDYEAALLYLKLYKVSLGSEIPDVLQEAFKEHLVRYTHQARIARERREREREQRLLDMDISPDRRWRPEDRN